MLANTTASARTRPIIGGTEAALSAWPWQVRVYGQSVSDPKKGFSCGGTLIGGQWVLTAGHCLFDIEETKLVQIPPANFRVVIGTNYIDKTINKGKILGVVQAIPNTDFNGATCNSADASNCSNDIALLRLSSTYTPRDPGYYHKQVTPIGLVTESTIRKLAFPGAAAVATGFGKTPDPTDRLMQADLVLSACSPGGRSDKPLCVNTGTAGSGPGTCQGDSGGPLVVHVEPSNEASSYLLAGVVSTTPNPCTAAGDDVFTSVANFIPWIQQTVGQLFFVQKATGPIEMSLFNGQWASLGSASNLGNIFDSSAGYVGQISGNLLVWDTSGESLLFSAPAVVSMSGSVLSASQLYNFGSSGTSRTLVASSGTAANLMSPLIAYMANAPTTFVWSIVFGPIVDTLNTVTSGNLIATPIAIQTNESECVDASDLQAIYEPVKDRILYTVPQILSGSTCSTVSASAQLVAYDIETGMTTTLLTAESGLSFQGIAADASGNIFVGQQANGPFTLTLLELPFGKSTSKTLGPLIVTTEAQGIDADSIHLDFDNVTNRIIYSSPIVFGGTPTLAAFDPITRTSTTLLSSTNGAEFDYPAVAFK